MLEKSLSEKPWAVASVVGVGLIGGSFALALRRAGFKGKIIGVSSPEAVKAALDKGVIDEALSLRDAAGQSDLIYLAQPIERILATLDEIDHHVYPGTLITDAGSTKAAIMARAAKRVKRGRFIGGHPMAGKQTRGVGEAEPGLFKGRPYVLTAPDAELERWIKRMGARVVILNADEHDRLVALTSHLPQLLSTALAASIAAEPGAERVTGPAAVDLTRLAMSPYEIWRDIFSTNRACIDGALGSFIERLQDLRTQLQSPEIEKEFERAAAAAKSLRQI
jgi:prephenate dehydrogenase